MASGSEPAASEWYQILVPALLTSILSALAFVGAYFSKKANEPEATPAGAVARKAVGAAFVDDTTAAAILRIDGHVAAIAKAAKERADKDHDNEIAERAAERAAEEIERRLAKMRKD